MAPKLKSNQTLFILRLLFEPEGIWLSEVKPKLETTDRDALVSAQLIAIEKRKKDGKGRGLLYVKLQEEGWRWATENLDAELSSSASNDILRRTMACIKARLLETETSLASFFASPGETDAATPVPPSTQASSPELTKRILAACQSLKGDGTYSGRVRLADLRKRLSDVPRDAFDRGLSTLEEEKQVAVYPLDNPQEIEPEDRDASMPNSIGQPRHIVYLSTAD